MPDGSDRSDVSPLVDLDAERAVLASCFLDPETALPAARGILTAEDFHDPRHAVTWEAILAAEARGGAVDFVTVSAELRRVHRLNTVGGPQFLAELTDAIPTTAHVEMHARLVRDVAVRRRLAAALVTAERDVLTASSADEAVERIRARLDRIGAEASTDDDCSLLGAAEALFVDLERAGAGQAVGVSTGVADLDAEVGGYFGGDLVILGADNGRGKTALALQGVRAVAEAGHEVNVFSYEMPAKRLLHRLAQHVAGVGEQQVRTGHITGEEMARHGREVSRASLLPVKVYGGRGGHVEGVIARVRANCAKAAREGRRVALVVVDYLQIMPATPRVDDPKHGEAARLSRVTGALKQLAMECGLTVLLLSQFNRDGNKSGEPTMHDFKGSGAIESDADVAIILHATDPEAAERVVIFPKNRAGKPGGRVPLRWSGQYQWLHSPAAEDRAAVMGEDFGDSYGYAGAAE